jgi:hypothetical protein
MDPQADYAQIALARDQAAALRIPLKVVRPEGVDVRALYEADLALIRPDQHVAWRGDQWDGTVLGRATGQERIMA